MTAAVLHVKSIARPDIRTTMYVIMNLLHFEPGILIANLLGGKLYKDYGGRILFMISAITPLIWAVIATLYYFIFAKNKFFDIDRLNTDTREPAEIESLKEQSVKVL